MERNIIHTEDGSHTLYVPELDEHFHSTHGAVQESEHVFIKNGLLKSTKKELVLFEVGFGTGLNALLTLLHKGDRDIHFISIEKFPLNESEYKKLNYCELIADGSNEYFLKMHDCEWNKKVDIAPGFSLTKLPADLKTMDFKELPLFDLVYFDAFAPNKQPDMWDYEIMQKIADHSAPNAIFSTYCAKGEVRRSLIKSGFNMQRLAGPPGKKEMLCGEKQV